MLVCVLVLCSLILVEAQEGNMPQHLSSGVCGEGAPCREEKWACRAPFSPDAARQAATRDARAVFTRAGSEGAKKKRSGAKKKKQAPAEATAAPLAPSPSAVEQESPAPASSPAAPPAVETEAANERAAERDAEFAAAAAAKVCVGVWGWACNCVSFDGGALSRKV